MSAAVDRANFDELRRTVEELHSCEATFLSSEHVRESFQGTTVWDGVVSIFAINGHLAAPRCYAWASESVSSGTRSVHAVLHLAPIESARDAVRASLAVKQR